MTALRAGARPARPLLAAAVAIAALAACAAGRPGRPAAAQPVPERRLFAVPGHGALAIAVPPGWTATATETEEAAPSVRLGRPGARFVALLTPMWDPGRDGEAERVDAVQGLTEMARRQALATSVEREIPLEEIVGEGVHGFWFGATDRDLASREPGADEWRHVLQGAAAVGPLVLVFTLLDDAAGPHREALLAVVRGARHMPGADPDDEEDAPGGFELDDDAPTAPLGVAFPGRTWTVLVDLPGFHVFKPRQSDGGVLVLGQDPRSGVVASVLLRPANGAVDAAACRDQALARIRAAAPELSDLTVAEAGPAARATYTVEELRGRTIRQRHSHAWLIRDGVCVAVHASKADPGAGDAERIDAILGSVRFGEDL